MLSDIKLKVAIEIRPNSRGDEYLEGVVQSKDLDALNAVLAEHLGHPVKKAGKTVKFEKRVLEVVNRLGGVRDDQTFYYCEKDDAVYYAALWPWQSDPLRITLKAGIIKKS